MPGDERRALAQQGGRAAQHAGALVHAALAPGPEAPRRGVERPIEVGRVDDRKLGDRRRCRGIDDGPGGAVGAADPFAVDQEGRRGVVVEVGHAWRGRCGARIIAPRDRACRAPARHRDRPR